MSKSQIKGELKRDLQLTDAVGIGLGEIIGAGIFVVTGVAAGVAGSLFFDRFVTGWDRSHIQRPEFRIIGCHIS